MGYKKQMMNERNWKIIRNLMVKRGDQPQYTKNFTLITLVDYFAIQLDLESTQQK